MGRKEMLDKEMKVRRRQEKEERKERRKKV